MLFLLFEYLFYFKLFVYVLCLYVGMYIGICVPAEGQTKGRFSRDTITCNFESTDTVAGKWMPVFYKSIEFLTMISISCLYIFCLNIL